MPVGRRAALSQNFHAAKLAKPGRKRKGNVEKNLSSRMNPGQDLAAIDLGRGPAPDTTGVFFAFSALVREGSPLYSSQFSWRYKES
jgi:hypothetical protein